MIDGMTWLNFHLVIRLVLGGCHPVELEVELPGLDPVQGRPGVEHALLHHRVHVQTRLAQEVVVAEVLK